MSLLAIFIGLFLSQNPVNIRGQVLDARTREPIAKALVSIRDLKLEATTDETGRFEMSNVPVGEVELYVTTVGYGLIKQKVQLLSGVDTEIEFQLGQEASRLSEEVLVTAPVFEPIEPHSVSEHTLNNTELKNLAGVLIDDPLRSVQTLPGVATGDDFNPDFAVRGFGFDSVGFYMDGVLTHSPFHTVRDIHDGGGLTIINGDLVDSVSLINGGAPAKYGDRTGAILNVQTRDGSRERVFSRVNVSATGFSFTNEGPIGARKKASWLVSGRKSYLDYVIDRITDEPTFVFSYKDLQGKLSFDPSDRHRLSLTVLLGDSGLNRDRILDRLGINALRDGKSQTQIYNARWRWLASERTLLQSSVFLTREDARNSNRTNETLFDSILEHLGVRQDLSVQTTSRHQIETGYMFRRIKESSTRRRFNLGTNQFQPTSQSGGSTVQPGGYAQDTWFVSDRIVLTGGMRIDHFAATGETVVLPRSSLSIAVAAGTHVTAAYGQYTQFPDFAQLTGEFNNPGLRAERAAHYTIGIEKLLTDKTRVRVEAYDQEVKELIFSAESEWRLSGGRILSPRTGAVLANSVRGHSRGLEFFIQRRSANRLSGWLSYSLGTARLRDTRTNLRFDSEFDQRHTFNAYGSYRLTKTLNISSKYRYGSGFPIEGYYRSVGDQFFISDQRNQARAPIYRRWDVRLNKAFFFNRWKLTLYGEVVNILNRKHIQYTDLDGINGSTGQVFLDYNTLLPVVPTAGVTIEF